jgi:flagellar protein FliO/FliZ
MVGLFLAAMVSAPFALKWLRKQNLGAMHDVGSQAKVLSALAVGPHQRVVTVEVGSEDARVRLTLGVTAQSISVLHSAPVPSPASVPTVVARAQRAPDV